MGRRTTPGTGQLSAEVELELLAELRAFAAARGETVRRVIERAVRRHLDNPPPVVIADPPLPADPPPAPKKKGRKT